MPGKHHTTSNHRPAKSPSGSDRVTSKIAWDGSPRNGSVDPVVPNGVEDGDRFSASNVITALVEEGADLFASNAEPKHWLLDHKVFQTIVYGTILLNSIQMGLATDHPDWGNVWTGFEHFFTAVFLGEMIIKLVCLSVKGYFSEGWNRLDFFLVSMSILDIWIVAPLSDGQGGAMSQLSVLRALRVLRVARMARLLKVFKELFVILKGMFDALRTIFWVCLLLVLTMYVCSILCVDVMGRPASPYPAFNDDIDVVEEAAGADSFNNYLYFGTMTRSMYTLFNIAMGEEAATVMRPIAERQFFMLFFFMFFIIFMSFGVLNVIIGVIVDSTAAAAKEMEREDVEKIKKTKLRTLLQIRNTLFALDKDNSGAISMDEIAAGWDDPQFRELIMQVELPKGFTPEEMLCLLDSDADGKLTFDEFITSFYRAITNDTFQQNCWMHASLNEVKRHCKHLDHKLTEEVSSIKEEISYVSSSLEDHIRSTNSSLKRIEALLQAR